MDAGSLIEEHEDFDYERFLSSLTTVAAYIVAARVATILGPSGNNLAGTHWVKALGGGLFEFRVRAPEVLVRIFFTYESGRIILLLGAYDKLRDPSARRQNNEINKARTRMK
jgi:putative component of toxin-antitoxin plasmid stabilization module